MSDSCKMQAMDVLLTQEWALTATLLQSGRSGFRAAALTATCTIQESMAEKGTGRE